MMNLQRRILGLVVVSLIVMSCKDTKTEAETEALTGETTTVAAPAVTTEAAVTPDTPVSNTPVAVPAATSTTQGMNPPHGQPGHRCEIPVGAPLNSQPNTASAPAQKPAQQPAPSFMQPAASQPAATTTAPGMNPPHGQPGHRCEIAVGAPLPK